MVLVARPLRRRALLRRGPRRSWRWAPAARRGSAGRRAHARPARAGARHRRRGRAAGGARSASTPAAGRCPGGWVEDGLLAEPVRLRAGPASGALPPGGELRPPRPARRCPRREWCCATRSGSRGATWSGAEPDELLVLPRTHPVRGAPGSGRVLRRAGRAARSRRPPRSRSTACGPYQPGSPASRIHWPALARGDEHDGAAPAHRPRRAPAGGPRHRAAARRGGGGRGGAGGGLAGRCTSGAPAAARCCCPASGARPSSTPTSAPGPPPTSAWRWSEAGRGPSAAALAPRSGPVLYVCPRVPRELPRTLRAAVGPRLLVVPGELSDRAPAFAVGGCRGYVMGREARARARSARRDHAAARLAHGPPAVSRAAPPAPPRVAFLLPAALARILAFAALCLFALAHWTAMVAPAARVAHAGRGPGRRSPPAARCWACARAWRRAPRPSRAGRRGHRAGWSSRSWWRGCRSRS